MRWGKYFLSFVAVSGLALAQSDPALEPVADLTQAGGANCTFQVEPDAFLDAEAKAHRANYERLLRFGKGLAPRAASAKEMATRAPAEIPIRNFIDEAIFGRLQREGVRSAPLSSDEEFLRRITLDLTGRVPTPAQIREFTASDNPRKRDELIDRLLNSPEFVDKWTMWFGDLLGNARTNVNFNLQNEGRNAFYLWIKQVLNERMSVKDIAWNVIAAKGVNFDFGPANYNLRSNVSNGPAQDTYDMAFYRAARDFLGMGHYDCILCHNGRAHLDQLSLWGRGATRTEAQRMAAFFSRQRYTAVTNDRMDPRNNARNVTDVATGDYALNTNFGNRPTRAPIGSTRNLSPAYRLGGMPSSGEWRQEFANFLIADPMFARNFANRFWKAMFNQGLVDSVEQLDPARLDPGNPPAAPWDFQASHPELLERLAQEFVRYDYNLREFLRILVSSSAYQLSSQYDDPWRPNFQPLFARHYPRRLEGEEIHDVLQQASQMNENYTVPGLDPVRWAMQLPEPSGLGNAFMNAFLRGNRDGVPRQQSGSILQQNNLMNDVFVTRRMKTAANGSPTLRAWAANPNNAAVVEDIFLTFLSRRPTAKEADVALGVLQRGTTPALRGAAIEDLCWTMVNKIEFIFSY